MRYTLLIALILFAFGCDENVTQPDPKFSEHCIRLTEKLSQPGLTEDQYRELKSRAKRDGCKIPKQ